MADLPEWYTSYNPPSNLSNLKPIYDYMAEYLGQNPYLSRDDIKNWMNFQGSDNAFNIFYGDILDRYYANAKDNIYNDVSNGLMSGNDALGLYGKMGLDIDPNLNSYLNNIVSQNNTQAANEQAEHMRDTSIISAAEQYANLGLNPASVISTGGAGSGQTFSAQAAQNNVGVSQAAIRNAAKQAEYNRKAEMAQTAIKVAGGLAQSGVYGGALYAAKTSAARIASSLANSGEAALKGLSSIPSAGSSPLKGKALSSWNDMLNQL